MSSSCKNPCFFLSFLLIFSYSFSAFSQVTDTIAQGQSIKDGETIISEGENFVLGFFSPENSTNRYVGIWFYKVSIQTVLWVANRENPLSDSSGVFRNDGNLMVLDGKGNSLWSSNSSALSSNSTSGNYTAILKDDGNLMLTNNEDLGNPYLALWQSFNNPTDTFVPGMIVGLNFKTGENQSYTSWKTINDPSQGNFSMGVDPQGFPQIVTWEKSKRHWRTGQWNGQTFTGVPSMRALYQYGFQFTNDEKQGRMYFTYSTLNKSDIIRFHLTSNGTAELLKWIEEKKEWSLTWSEPINECELYNKCGAFGSCNILNSPICSCIEGFEPKSVDEWSKGNWSSGCVRRTELQCERNGSNVGEVKRDGFLKLERAKVPDFLDGLLAISNKTACESECLKNCSCTAYAEITGTGCMIWGRNLVDIQQFSEGGNDLYIRLSDSELGGKSKISIMVIIIIIVAGTIFLTISMYLLWRIMKGKLKKGKGEQSLYALRKSSKFLTNISGPDDLVREGSEVKAPELPMFNFNSIEVATNYFSLSNKLGEGGFGPVYKGTLPGGKDIAVKRLSRRSGQGLEEFKNEIILIAKLQHRNLVRLLGCCIQGEEKMLIYEYMHNKSLDFFIFHPAKQGQLDWKKRFNIIEGIARGLLYLHRDSRLRIIHRDLKASNILLDEDMNPKISDFGMAKIFGGNQNELNTKRVVGTYGYMAPEYAMEGLFSVKSDVYSFGVLLLEIISGKRNNNSNFRHSGQAYNLVGYAWSLWNDKKAMEFIDPSIQNSCLQSEVLRCIHVGLLCLQDSAIERPSMSSVSLMLESETATLAMPKQPIFTMGRDHDEYDLSLGSLEMISTDTGTITMDAGR